MRRAHGRITPREERFCQAFARTNDPAYSALKAGYAMPEVAGFNVLKRPIAQQRIEALRNRLMDEAVAPAMERLVKVLKKSKSDTAAISAVDKVFKGVGLYQAKPDDGSEKEAHEMSVAELYAIARHHTVDPTISDVDPAETPKDLPNDDIFA